VWIQEPFYGLSSISNLYDRKLTNWHYLSCYPSKINKNMMVLPFAKPISSRRQSEGTKLKISKANKGKRLGCAPWNKGRKLLYIPGKREHSEETKRKMSEAARRRWTQHQ
jgi:NUMOD3 motif